MQYLDLADLMVIAEALTGTAADELVQLTDRHGADCALNAPRAGYGDVELYPDLAAKAARLCWDMIRYEPLPSCVIATAYVCMTEFIERNLYRWIPTADQPDGGNEVVEMLAAVQARTVHFKDFADWVRLRIEAL